MSDPTIKQIQYDLNTLGFGPLTEDGVLGPKTRAAMIDYAQGREGALERLRAEAETKRVSVPQPPPGYLDLVDRCTLTEWRRCSTCRKNEDECKHGGGPLPRSWASITGITLHQTGCPMSSKPERWLNLKAHYGVTYEGGLYRIHRETDFGWHAQGLSAHQIGIEIAGLFCGVEGDPSTRPGAPVSWGTHSITTAQIESTRALIRYLCSLAEHHGGKITDLNAHRQAAPKDDPRACRTPDPGSKTWQKVALPMMAELGLSDGGVGFTMGRGEPIPDVWSGVENGIAYRG